MEWEMMEWEIKVLRVYTLGLDIWRWPHQLRKLALKDKLRLQLFLFDPRLELLLFGLRQLSMIGSQLCILLSVLMLGIISLVILILYSYCEGKLSWFNFSWFDFFLFLLGLLSSRLLIPLLGLLSASWFLKIKKTFNGYKSETIFPEEWQADLKTLQERWMKQSYSCQKIRFLTIKHIFHMGLGYIQIQLENIWLPNNASTKEIE